MNDKGWVLVTGAAKRLGAEMALYLAERGYSIIVHYNTSKDEAYHLVQQCQQFNVHAKAIQGDFSSPAAMAEFSHQVIRECPALRFLVNNVGNYLLKSALNTSVKECIELFQTNFFAPLFLIQSLMPMLSREQGKIVNIGVTGMSCSKISQSHPIYNMTKQSLLSLTRSLAKEMAPQGVCVNMVSPGYLDIAVDLPDDVTSLPMERAGYCWEVARVVAFLLDDQSGYITGQNIEVAGGVGL